MSLDLGISLPDRTKLHNSSQQDMRHMAFLETDREITGEDIAALRWKYINATHSDYAGNKLDFYVIPKEETGISDKAAVWARTVSALGCCFISLEQNSYPLWKPDKYSSKTLERCSNYLVNNILSFIPYCEALGDGIHEPVTGLSCDCNLYLDIAFGIKELHRIVKDKVPQLSRPQISDSEKSTMLNSCENEANNLVYFISEIYE